MLMFLHRFLPFAHGPPSHDQVGDVFAMLDTDAFLRCFVTMTSRLAGVPEEVHAIDGKPSCRTLAATKAEMPFPVTSD